MPIKFPKFSRRKSVGAPLEAAYEPANPDNHFANSPDPEVHDGEPEALGSGYGGFGVPPRPNRGSDQTSGSAYSSVYYGGSNRLSSNSTLHSTDTPRTPDDYRPQLPDHGSPYGSSKSLRPASTFMTTTNPMRSVVNPLRNGPRTNSMTAITPPRLETSLDTTSLFGEDMFDFNAPKNSKDVNSQVTPTAPKLASNAIINPSENHDDIPPVPPPKSYNPATSPTVARFGECTTSTYKNMFASPQHMDSDRAGSESSPYHWEPPGKNEFLSSSSAPNASNSPRNSRNLTPSQTMLVPTHSRNDSLNTPSSRPSRNSRQGGSSGGNVDSAGLKRNSAMRRQSIVVEDEDALIVAGAVVTRNGGPESASRPPANHSNSSPATLGPSVKRISDKVKDRDSGWEEGPQSGSASSNNSVRADSWSASSKETTATSPAMSRGNTEQDINRGGPESNNTTPKAKKSGLVGVDLKDGNDDTDFDVTISAAAALVAQYEDTDASPQPPPPSKVMTRAQFELLQQQQDDQRRLSGKMADDESDISDYEEEVETERNKEAAKQRAKQDAHLSVYRQQMMKVTGTQSELPLGMNSRPASMSTSALPLPLTAISGPSSSGKSSEEEDEEIPLGILMAHGFPNKNRPPTRLSNASSQPNLRAMAQNQQDPRLPPFARNLPADPYNIGASIVNPTNRMSLAFSAGGGPGSVAGGSMYNAVPPAELPGRGPKGLVGEIMRAEEMKAARKGHLQYVPEADPFKQDPFKRSSSPSGGMLGYGAGGMPQNGGGMGASGMGGQGMMGQQPGMGMGMNSGANSTDPMQLQIANQMQQMMQLQMQWMQMQMQGAQPQQLPSLQPPQLPQQPQQSSLFMPGMMQPQQRPNSMANAQSNGMPAPQQRTMSMVNPPQFQAGRGAGYAPSVAPSQMPRPPTATGGNFLGPPGYTPSIAPSERSNIGMPSRYRPVSYQPPSSAGARTSTLTSASGNDLLRKSPGPSHLKNVDDDDDDETGWEELNKKRKEKKDGWRKKKDGGLKGMLHFGTTAASSNSAA